MLRYRIFHWLRKKGILSSDNRFLSKKEYNNPIENQLYVTKGEFKTYQGGKEINPSPSSIPETKLKKIVLLNTDQEMNEASLTADEISPIIQEVDTMFQDIFLSSQQSGKILVQFELGRDEHELRFAFQDDVDLDKMAEFERRVSAREYPKSQGGPIKFQILFLVNARSE